MANRTIGQFNLFFNSLAFYVKKTDKDQPRRKLVSCNGHYMLRAVKPSIKRHYQIKNNWKHVLILDWVLELQLVAWTTYLFSFLSLWSIPLFRVNQCFPEQLSVNKETVRLFCIAIDHYRLYVRSTVDRKILNFIICHNILYEK